MSKNTLSEIEILKASLQGQTSAFEIIVKKYQSLICAITYSATGSVERSEELAQQAFVKCWKNLGQLKDLTKFRAWLCSIARHAISDSYRRQQNDITSKAIGMDSIQEQPSEDTGPVEAAISKEREAIVNEALSKIPDTFREPLVLYYREGRSYRQVADQLGFSEHTARERISRARSLLREKIASLVEETIERTKPGKVFTTAVIASIAGLAIKGSGAAAAGGIAATTSTAGTATGVAAIMSGVTAKIITAAAIAAIGVGAVVTYKQFNKPEQGPDLSQAGMIVQEQGEDQDAHIEKTAEQEQGNEVDNSFAKTIPEIRETGSRTSVMGSGIRDDSHESENKTGISGIVIDKSSSKSIKGAEVFYGPRKNPHGSFFTDAGGHFEFLDMKPRRGQFFYIVAKNYTSRRITLDMIKDKVYENFKIELTAGSKVAGVVYKQNDKPVKGATVRTFVFTNHPLVTDANGSFEIDGLDPAWGQYSLHVTHPNYPAVSVQFTPANAGETAWRDVVLKPGVTIYGRVTDAEGNPVANVDIGNTTSRSMWNCIEAKTNQQGKYELKNVDSGDLVLWAVINKYAPYVERFSLDGSEARKLINIQLSDPLPLHGKIVDKQGNPVSGVNISIREYKGVSNLTNRQDRVSSDSEGKFIIPNAPPTGTVILSVFAEQVPNTHPEIEAGQEEEHVITVDRAGRLYGKVIVDDVGKPIRKILVKLSHSEKGNNPGFGYSATWNREGHNFDSKDGFFDTGSENIPIGAEYSMTVYADGFAPLTIDPVVVQPISQEPNRTEFRLKPATAIAGRVVDSNSSPIAAARIRIISDNTDFEHWDDRDTTVTNPKGEFLISGAGSQEQCIYITAATFAPYFGLSTDLPKNSEGTIQITLNPGAEVFGRVVDTDGQVMSGARICAHIFSKQMRKVLSSPGPSLDNAAYTDMDGYYELFDLPSGDFSVGVLTPLAQGSLNFAQKKITLEEGQSMELNFGDEVGFRLTGVVRMGKKLLEKANVQIRLPDNSTKWGHSDSEGRFRISGIPKGTYTINTSYHSGFDPKTFQWGPGERLSDNRQVVVESNVEMDIDLGDGIVSGKIPVQFMENEKLQITARRLVPKKPDKDILLPETWGYAGEAKIDSDGKFSCPNLRAGRYYLLLSSDRETLGITDDFELGESEHIDNVTFNTGNGTLQINVVDADTSQGVSDTGIYIKNDLGVVFFRKNRVPEGSRYGVITDGNGRAEYSSLPDGSYVVWTVARGYLPSESEWVKVSSGEITPVTLSLEPAAVVRFELDCELQKRITGEYSYLRCRVSNTKTGDIVPIEHAERMVWLAPEDTSVRPELKLPEGQYQIEYSLYQGRRYLSYKVKPPLLEGTVNVEIDKGETKLITVSE